MKSRRRQLSLFVFMSLVTTICMCLAFGRAWLFPPSLQVDVPSRSEFVINGSSMSLLEADAVFADYAKQWHDKSGRARMTIIVNKSMASTDKSAAANSVLQRASAHKFDHCAVRFNDLDHLVR